MTVALILNHLSTIPREEHLDYIAKHNRGPLTDNEILTIFNEDRNSINASGIVAGIAKDIIHHADPKNWLGKTFGNWIATDIIYGTNKSIILKGEPIDKDHKQTVAIKILSPTFQAMSNDKHQAMQAHYIEKLKCPNMVEMKSAGSTPDGINYIVMEYLCNDNVVAYCSTNNLSLSRRLYLFLSICRGVMHMHQHMVVHADLKPLNILIDKNNQPKIIDLDLSIALDNSFNDQFSYQNIKGHTNQYAAPEQKSGGAATALSDIYSLGLVLREVLLEDKTITLHKNTLKLKYPKQGRLNELVAMIDKCCQEDPVDRYDSVSALKDDIEIYLEARNISKAYIAKTNYTYRAYRYIIGRKLFFSITTTFTLLIALGISSIVIERNEANNALTLMAQLFDPRELNEKMTYERKANEVLEQKVFFQAEQFNKLITFGDGYYGRGKGGKSIAFFEKAKALYPDENSSQHIIASTKLALAYFSMLNHTKANEQFQNYLDVLFVNKLKSPELIQMFLAYIEVNSILRPILEDAKRSSLSVLKDIDLGSYKDKDLQALTQMQIQYYLGLESFYSSDFGDYASNSTSQTEHQLETITNPLSIKTKQYFVNALNILKENQINSHFEALIYSWIGRMEGELQNIELALAYNDIALQKTTQIYGPSHPQTIDVIIRRFVITRFSDPKEALKSALKMKELINIAYTKPKFKLFYDRILAEAYYYAGDWQNSVKIVEKNLDYYKSNVQELEEQNSFVNIPLLNTIAMVTEMNPLLKGDFKKYIEAEAHIDMLESKASGIDEEILPYNLYRVIQVAYIHNAEGEDSAINELIDKAHQFLEESSSTSERSSEKLTNNIKLAELCLTIESCEPEKYLAGISYEKIHNSYTNQEVDYSAHFFTQSIRLAYLYFFLEDYDSSIFILNDLLNKKSFSIFPNAYYVWVTKYILNAAKYRKTNHEQFFEKAENARAELHVQLGDSFTLDLNLKNSR